MKRLNLWGVVALLAVAGFVWQSAAEEAPAGLKLEKGDHICIIGNTLAERMQHDGWLETLIHSRFPEHDLVFRNLGYSGDEVRADRRLRSYKFGTPDEWLAGNSKPAHTYTGVRENRFELTNTKADVVFAFFGYNESYAGEAGLAAFKADLAAMLKGMLAQKYNGKSAPRIVLFSPTGFEDLKDPNFPDGATQNKNLKLYTDAMAEVAKANGVVFVDLYTPTQAAYEKNKKPLTINGLHLNEAGEKTVAEIADAAIFGKAQKNGSAKIEKLREAVSDKNWFWFHRYRTTDGYSNFGDRGGLKFVDGQQNYEVLQRESEVLDVMVANRDQRIWAVAKGSELKVDDSNTPPFVEVKTNKPGQGPEGAHLYLGGEAAIAKMKPGKGLKVNLYASEEMFPELVNPQQMAWDTKGRLWVTAWPSYPHWTPKTAMNDKLLILEDTDGDGKADKCKHFADDIHSPTGFEFYNGGVLIACGPELYFLKDTDGDDKYDVKERVLHGFDTADTHHTANSFVLDPGGALYFQEGTFHHSQIESPWGAPSRLANGGAFRFEPRTHKSSVYVSYGFANPHGHVFDKWGRDIMTDGTGNVNYYAAAYSGHVDFPQKHDGMQPIFNQRTRPCGGTEILSSAHFPEEFQGNFLNANVIGFQGILRYKIDEKESGIVGTELEPIVYSEDPNFRPVDIEVGPDGAIYFVDWHNTIIGHMQHNLRDPSRDKTHGRIYRVTHEGREPLKAPKIAGESVKKLVALLASPEDRVRYRAKIELSGRKTDDVIEAVKKWSASLDKNDKNYEHHMMEALWMHQYHNVVDEPLLSRMLRSPEPHARAAATRVLCYWRDRVKEPLSLLKVQVTDGHPRVRLEAVRACSFFTTPEAAEVALESLNHPQDYYLKYTLDQTMKTLDKYTK